MRVHHDGFNLMGLSPDGRLVLCGRLVRRGDETESDTATNAVTCEECAALLDEALQREIVVMNGRMVEMAQGPSDPRGGSPEGLGRSVDALRAMLADRGIVTR